MNSKYYFAAFILGISVYTLYAILQTAPGYMDAEYYYSMGLRIARDGSLSEPFLWNYLHESNGVPHPGFTYWMPLPAFIAACGMAVSGLMNFTGAKIGFVLIAGFVPVVTMKVTHNITKSGSHAFLAGIFSLFPVFYSAFTGTTDSFVILMILGGLFVLTVQQCKSKMSDLILGVIAGLIHLTRADGLIWLAIGVVVTLITRKKRLQSAALVVIGYLLVMGPWLIRNWIVLGEMMPSGTSRMFWLTEYNDIFMYQIENLNFENWIRQGLGGIIKNIAVALLANVKTAVIVQGQIVLAPLVAVGFWRHKNEPSVWSAATAYILIFVVMSAVFPFAGQRGGFLHSGAAIQPLIWVLGSSGYFVLIDLGVKKRGWQREKASLLFGVSLTVLLVFTTVFVYWDRVVGVSIKDPQWNKSFQESVEIGMELKSVGASQSDLVIINNPPGLYAATGLLSIVIPAGDVDSVLQAASAFDADYFVLEKNHPVELDALYQEPGSDDRLDFIGTKDGVHYFSLQ